MKRQVLLPGCHRPSAQGPQVFLQGIHGSSAWKIKMFGMKFRALLPGCKRPSALDLEVFGKECRALLQGMYGSSGKISGCFAWNLGLFCKELKAFLHAS